MGTNKITLIDILKAAISNLEDEISTIEIDNSMIHQNIEEESIEDMDENDFYVFYVKDLKNDHNLLNS